MYHRYFGLQEEPFSIAVNPKYLFMSTRHRDALAHLLYGVGAGGGFVLLTGEVGTGKTTINRCLLEQLPTATDVAIVLNPALNADELLATVCDELGVEYNRDDYTLKSLTDRLHSFLLDNHGRGRNTVLLIDEAQHLQFEVLEQIRLLTNLETNTRKLLQIILVGQPELTAVLGKPELRQLNQRITARFDLRPLNLEETHAYIRHRLQVAGLPANQELFPASIVRGIHRKTRGIPRLINVLCDRMLLGTYGQSKNQADPQILRQAAAEVLGEEVRTPARVWLSWGLLVSVLVVAVLAVLWWRGDELQSVAAPTAIEPAQGELSRLPLTPQVGTGDAMPAGRAAGEDPTAPVASLTAAAGGSAAQTSAAQERSVSAQSNPWYGSREVALVALAAHLGVAVAPGDGACAALTSQGLACETQTAQTWDELLEFNRPAVLSLITRNRFAAYATLVSIEGDKATLLHEGGEREITLAELGDLWRGEFVFVWQPPADYAGPVSRGIRSPMVAWLAREFAQLDGQDDPLAGDEFNAALDARVRLFQRSFRLRDDGVVGLKTLLKFNDARGLGRQLAAAQPALAGVGER